MLATPLAGPLVVVRETSPGRLPVVRFFGGSQAPAIDGATVVRVELADLDPLNPALELAPGASFLQAAGEALDVLRAGLVGRTAPLSDEETARLGRLLLWASLAPGAKRHPRDLLGALRLVLGAHAGRTATGLLYRAAESWASTLPDLSPPNERAPAPLELGLRTLLMGLQNAYLYRKPGERTQVRMSPEAWARQETARRLGLALAALHEAESRYFDRDRDHNSFDRARWRKALAAVVDREREFYPGAGPGPDLGGAA